MTRRHYISGGTTGKPKVRAYSSEDWDSAIRVKADFLDYHGVGKASRVLVLHPFAPWSIGRIHAEAAESLGASVLCLGPRIGGFLSIANDFAPTTILGTARMASNYLSTAKQASLLELVIHAGEPLLAQHRANLAILSSCRLIDCYGMSEFDMVAVELDKMGELWMRPGLTPLIRQEELSQVMPMKVGLLGELFLAESVGKSVQPYATGDIVSVVGFSKCPISSWQNAWSIRFLRRVDVRYFLPDGTSIGSADIDALRTRLERIDEAQFEVHESGNTKPLIYLRYTGDIPPGKVTDELLAVNLDLADAVGVGLVNCPKAQRVEQRDFKKTRRGKIVAVDVL